MNLWGHKHSVHSGKQRKEMTIYKCQGAECSVFTKSRPGQVGQCHWKLLMRLFKGRKKDARGSRKLRLLSAQVVLQVSNMNRTKMLVEKWGCEIQG